MGKIRPGVQARERDMGGGECGRGNLKKNLSDKNSIKAVSTCSNSICLEVQFVYLSVVCFLSDILGTLFRDLRRNIIRSDILGSFKR